MVTCRSGTSAKRRPTRCRWWKARATAQMPEQWLSPMMMLSSFRPLVIRCDHRLVLLSPAIQDLVAPAGSQNAPHNFWGVARCSPSQSCRWILQHFVGPALIFRILQQRFVGPARWRGMTGGVPGYPQGRHVTASEPGGLGVVVACDHWTRLIPPGCLLGGWV